MAHRLNVEPEALLSTLKQTVCKGCSDSEMMAFSIVANEYGLNPFIKHIYAFPAKGGGIVPVVSVDGWITMANNHPQMDGIEFEDEHDERGQLVAIACTIYRKDRTRPIRAKEYLDECKRPTDPWKMPHRMLRHKSLIQTCRIAFGFSGVYDEDEADDIARNGGMRETTGRVVEEVQGNPYEAPAAAPAPAAPAKGKGKSKEAAAPVAETAPEPSAPADPEDAVVIPPRIEMVNGFKADWKRAEVTQAFAEAKYIEAGVMEKGMTLSKLTDEQLFSIYEKSQGILGLSPEEKGDPQ